MELESYLLASCQREFPVRGIYCSAAEGGSTDEPDFKKLEGQLARWLEKLQSYDFCIAYRARKSPLNADALSWRPRFETNCVHCQRQEEREFR